MSDVANRALAYGFFLAVLLVLVVYFVGVSTEAPALASAIRTLIYSVTGRNTQGNFASYPSGAQAPAQSAQ